MKKLATCMLSIVLLFSMLSFTAFAGTPDSTNGAGISIVKVSGDLAAPGNTVVYKISDKNGDELKDFSNYEVTKSAKVPLQISDVKKVGKEYTFEVSLLDTCSPNDVAYSGKVTFKNKTTNETTSLSFDGTAKNTINSVSGNIVVSSSSGSKIYDFTNTSGTTTIVFGEDAEVKLSGTESGAKCLSYNLDPNQSIKTKYKLNASNSAFINFVGEPEFINKITTTFMIPIDTKNPVLYQLKSGTTNELEEVNGYHISTNGSESVITFDTMSLKKTYVVVSGKLQGTGQAEPVELIEDTNEQNPSDTTTTVDDSAQSPQTGSNLTTYATLTVALLGCLVLVLNRKRKN